MLLLSSSQHFKKHLFCCVLVPNIVIIVSCVVLTIFTFVSMFMLYISLFLFCDYYLYGMNIIIAATKSLYSEEPSGQWCSCWCLSLWSICPIFGPFRRGPRKAFVVVVVVMVVAVSCNRSTGMGQDQR